MYVCDSILFESPLNMEGRQKCRRLGLVNETQRLKGNVLLS